MKPLNRSITIACILFIIILCLVLSVATWNIYTHSMYDRYQKQMLSLVNYMDNHIDRDDLAVCARTYVESDKYRELQAFLDNLIDNYQDVHYLYIMQAVEVEDGYQIYEICAANSTYEKENEPELCMYLGDTDPDWYTDELERKIWQIQQGDEDVFFDNPSEWGDDYTLSRPLISSNGDHYALLCVDVSVEELNASIYRNVYINISQIVFMGLLFTLFLLLWMRANVTNPLRQLEKSVTDFAGKSIGKRDPDELVFTPPDIRPNNEVRSLANAVTQLSVNMRDYVKNMLAAENESRGLQEQVYRDALTKLGNKAAYDRKRQALEWDILNNIAEFAMVMVDLNWLKVINDRYGHDRGNDYILDACRLICQVFAHSPVYRIGGDEFVAVLQGDDYQIREQLCDALKERFQTRMKNESAEPWERCSAAVGMSTYEPGDTVDEVLERADREMYADKKRMKTGAAPAGDQT